MPRAVNRALPKGECLSQDRGNAPLGIQMLAGCIGDIPIPQMIALSLPQAYPLGHRIAHVLAPGKPGAGIFFCVSYCQGRSLLRQHFLYNNTYILSMLASRPVLTV